MSRLVAFAAIQGGYNVVSQVEGEYKKALATFNADTKVGFPNTAYYLPVIYSLLGLKVETLEDIQKPLEVARKLLPPHIKGMNHLPYLGPLLDAGMATLFAFEIREALRYLNEPDFYLHSEDIDEEAGKIWLGACGHRRGGAQSGNRQGDCRRVPEAQSVYFPGGRSQRHLGRPAAA
jgi:acetyl-CoA synthase